MRKLISIVLAILSIDLFAAENQNIIIDNEHIQIGLEQGKVGSFYSIKPCSSLIVDISQYKFEKLKGMSTNVPNSLQIIIGNKGKFSLVVKPGISKYYLNSATLIPESEAFGGFKSGEQVVLALGELANGKKDFNVMWAGIIKVQP